MPSIPVPSVSATALTANGGSDGTLTVASTTLFYSGCIAYLRDTNGLTATVLITQILTATTMKARKVLDTGSNVNSLSYATGSDLSTFTTANSAKIAMPAQTAEVNQPTFSKI